MFPRGPGRGSFLYALRLDAGLTQKQPAEPPRVSQTTYPPYGSGALDIPSLSLVKPARFYKTSVDCPLGLTNGKSQIKGGEMPAVSGKGSKNLKKALHFGAVPAIILYVARLCVFLCYPQGIAKR